METFNVFMETVNGVLWHDYVLYVILGVGLLLMIWTKFSPIIALTHGVDVVRGKYDKKDDPGAISHFQALSAALSATVGLGNIGGVAVAISLGGPGAVFWMWIVGFFGMAIKTTEVTQSMLYRNTTDPDNPHGGPMFVVSQGLAQMRPELAALGRGIAYVFCLTLLVSTVTGGNMFQAWNVGTVTELNFGIPAMLTGVILAIITALVIIGGIKRIGAVAGQLVPFMCGLYLMASLYVLLLNFAEIPGLLRLIVVSAFGPTQAQGAFIGGTFGYAFLWGMKRALFSNEAGQGSSPIAHSAARTDEPVREGIVAGLEPFIDTLVVCTLTALVILSSGAWNRGPAGVFDTPPAITQAAAPGQWTLDSGPLPPNTETDWVAGQGVFVLLDTGSVNEQTGTSLTHLYGTVTESNGVFGADWTSFTGSSAPTIDGNGVYSQFTGASLTSHAFDRARPGLGRWLVTLAAWLFAISTMISWSYYGEQGIVFMLGAKWVRTYKIIYCLLILVATSGFISTDRELDNLTTIGTGVMLFANIPIILIFGRQAMEQYHDYVARLKAGEFKRN
jgi:AGCS family alanine or glycine:cation symporter